MQKSKGKQNLNLLTVQCEDFSEPLFLAKMWTISPFESGTGHLSGKIGPPLVDILAVLKWTIERKKKLKMGHCTGKLHGL